MKFKKKQIMLGLLILAWITFSFYPILNLEDTTPEYTNSRIKFDIKSSQFVLSSSIIINQSEPTQTWAYTALNYPWCSGSGIMTDPYVIQDVHIDLNGVGGSCISIIDSTVVYFEIQDCTLINSGWDVYENAGIRLINSYNGFLYGNNCSSHEYNGIYLYESDNNTISGNIANENQRGIQLIQSHKNTIINNALNQNHNGMYISQSHNTTINGNVINYNNIYITGSENCSLSSNIFSNGGIDIAGELDELNTLQIALSNLANSKPIYYYTNKEGLKNSDFANPGQILLVNCSDSSFSNFDLTYTSTGLYVVYSDNITISDGDFNYNDAGINIAMSTSIDIFDNNANYNNFVGIRVYSSEDCICSGNTANSNYDSEGNGDGIGFFDCENCTISGNTASNNFYAGLDIPYCNEMIISGNTFSNQYYGIEGYNIDNSLIDGNIINGRATLELWCAGIYFTYQSYNNTLINNQLNNCGIKFDDNDELLYLKSHNIDTTNLANGKPIYYYVDQDGLLAGAFYNAGQIILVNTSNSIMDNLQISNTSTGIWLFHSNDNTISSCNMKYNKEQAIYLLFSNNTVITGNVIDNNAEDALYLRSCEYNNITYNTITDDRENNPRTGISLQECNHCNVRGNNVSDCLVGLGMSGDHNLISFNNFSDNQDNGIWIYNSDYNTFNNNSMNNNWNGFTLEQSNNNDIIGNEIKYNKEYGLNLYECNDNTIIGNTFYCNNQGCWQEYGGTGNTFDNNICEDCPEEDGNGGPGGVPGYNLLIIIGIISIFITLLIRKRRKH